MAITTDPGEDISPKVTCCGGDEILVVWQSNRNGDWNIYQSTYQDDWTSPSPVTTDNANQIDPVALSPAYGVASPVYSSDINGYWDIYHNTFSTTSFTLGDATRDGIINLADAIYILNYLFKDGPAPDPLATADVNCDQTVNMADALCLLIYLFRDGDPPGC
jgi:hypothetical protein